MKTCIIDNILGASRVKIIEEIGDKYVVAGIDGESILGSKIYSMVKNKKDVSRIKEVDDASTTDN